MNRTDLDRFVAHYRLPVDATYAALRVSGAVPDRAETLRVASKILQLAGVLSVATGVIFFVAANWSAISIFGRFALIEIVFVGAGALALWQPPPSTVGRLSLLAAFLSLGALLALFGQTYQTGADVYELFLTWAALGAIFAVTGRWSVIWGAWLIVLNLSLLLFCSQTPAGGWLWLAFGGLSGNTPLLLLVPSAANLTLWLLASRLHASDPQAWPRWLVRLTLTCLIAFATWAAAHAIFDHGVGDTTRAPVIVLVLALLASTVLHTVSRRRDIYPLALTTGSLIVLTTCAILETVDLDEASVLLVLSAWLIASSTVAGRILMKVARLWAQPPDESAA